MNDHQKKVLGEVCLESSKNAGDALKMMINKEVCVEFPKVELKHISLHDALNTDSVFGVSDVTGDLGGSIIIVYPKESGMRLLDMIMMQKQNTLTEMTEDAKGAFLEFLNIIAGAFLTTLSNHLNFNAMPKPPEIYLDSNSFRNDIDRKIRTQAPNIFYVDTFLNVESEQIGGHFFLLFDNKSIDKIFSALG